MPSSTRVLVCILLVLAGCSSRQSADVTTTSAISGPTSVRPVTLVDTAPAVTTTTVPKVTTTLPPPTLQLVSLSYGCGPADGPWVEATVVSSIRQSVLGQVWFQDQPYGQSELVSLQPGVAATLGFDPSTPADAFGDTAVTRIVAAEDPASSLATGEIVLKLRAGVSCG